MTKSHYSLPKAAALAAFSLLLASGFTIGFTCGSAQAQERVGEVSTTFRMIGPNDKVVVDR